MEAASKYVSDMIASRKDDLVDMDTFKERVGKEITDYDSTFELAIKKHHNKVLEQFCSDVAPKLREKRKNNRGGYSYPWKLLCDFWELYVEGLEAKQNANHTDTIKEFLCEEKIEAICDQLAGCSNEDLINMGRFTLSTYFQYIASFHTLTVQIARQSVFEGDDPLIWMRRAKEFRPVNFPFDIEELSKKIGQCLEHLYAYNK